MENLQIHAQLISSRCEGQPGDIEVNRILNSQEEHPSHSSVGKRRGAKRERSTSILRCDIRV
jgi:hypothetical protein